MANRISCGFRVAEASARSLLISHGGRRARSGKRRERGEGGSEKQGGGRAFAATVSRGYCFLNVFQSGRRRSCLFATYGALSVLLNDAALGALST